MNATAHIDIVLPSYRRPEILINCLEALGRQEFEDFSVLCVCRATDIATREVVAAFNARDERFVEILVEKPGLVAALNAGLHAVTAEYVAFTDDDAEAPPHWLSTIVGHFDAHPMCGAVGGPDRLQLLDEPALANPPPAKRVGVYSWFGRMAAAHHHPIMEPYLRCISLKGVNMSFRHRLIKGSRIGDGLRGQSCTVGTEQGLCANVVKCGFEIHFVRDAWLKHFCAPRTASDSRLDAGSAFALDATYNSAYVLWRYQPLWTALRAHFWIFLVGPRKRPGLVRVFMSPSLFAVSSRHWVAGWCGALQGARDRGVSGSDTDSQLDGAEAS
jgi:cellulose synthase/poly-beta-1,6-N-acetylglucosamine synthase-like glycosyltransferase